MFADACFIVSNKLRKRGRGRGHLIKYQRQIFWCHLTHIDEVETLDHVEGALLVGQEVGRLDVVLVGFLRSVYFEDAYLTVVAELLHRICR